MILKQYTFRAPLQSYGFNLDDFPFDDPYLDKLLGFMGRGRDEIDLRAFAQDHFNLLHAFIQTRIIEAKSPSITQETKALNKAQNAAWSLVEALREVRSKGEAGDRLLAEGTNLPKPRLDKAGVSLSRLLGWPEHDPYLPLQSLLFDLQVALQRAKIEKPRARPAFIDTPETSAQTRNDNRVRQAAKDDGPAERYRVRAAHHGMVANSPLADFAARLWDMWPKYSARTFTEGRYEGQDIGNNSATLDFAETCLKAFGAKYRRSLIAQKLRAAKELLPYETPQ